MAADNRLTHPAVPDLRAVLDVLRRPPFRLRIGLDREIRCVALLQRLDEHGVELGTAADAAGWLAPLVSNNAADQQAVHDVLHLMADRTRSARPEPDTPGREGLSVPRPAVPAATAASVPGIAPPNPRAMLLAVASGVAAAGAAVAFVQHFGTDPPAPGVPGKLHYIDGPLGMAVLPPSLGILTALLVWLLAFLLHTRREAHLLLLPASLERRIAGGDAEGLHFFAPGSMRPVLRALREHLRPVGTFPDIPASIRTTISAGGLPTLVFGGRPRLPDYLLLAEARGPGDQGAILARLLHRRLLAAQVHVEAYGFALDPLALRRWNPSSGGRDAGATDGLLGVSAQAAGSRLLVVSDGRALFDPLSGGLLPHLAVLRGFQTRVLLTPVVRNDWGARERALAAEGFTILPLSPDGLADLANWMVAPEEHPPPSMPEHDEATDLVARIEADPVFRQAQPPSAAEQSRALTVLRRQLGPAGFRLLAATAASPTPGTGLTIRMARRFAAEGYAIDEAGLAQLTRLPWMRRGAMPVWLRQALLADLMAPERLVVLDTLLLLLAGADEEPRALDTTSRSRLAHLASRHGGALVHEDRVLGSLLAEAGARPGPSWREVVLTSLVIGAGLPVAYAGDSVLRMLARITTLLPDIGSLSTAVALAAASVSLAALVSLTFPRFRPVRLPLALAAFLVALLAGSPLDSEWQNTLLSFTAGAVLVSLVPVLDAGIIARVPPARPWPAAWLTEWPAPQDALFLTFMLAAIGLAAASDLDFTNWISIWLRNEVTIIAALLLAGLAAGSGMGALVPRAETAAWTLLFGGAEMVCWAVLNQIGLGRSGTIVYASPILFQAISPIARLFGGGAVALLLSGRVRSPTTWMMLAAFGGLVALSIVDPEAYPAYLLLSAVPFATLIAAYACGMDLPTAARAGAIAMLFRLLAILGCAAFFQDAIEPASLATLLLLSATLEWAFLRWSLAWAVVLPSPDWRLWRNAAVLLPCLLSWSAGIATWPGVPWLALPLAAGLASRHGLAALGPVGVVLSPMLVSVHAGFVTLGGDGLGLWLSALLVVRLFADPGLITAVARTTELPGWLPWALAAILSLGLTTTVGYATLSLSGGALLPPLVTLAGLSRIRRTQVLTSVLLATGLGVLVHLFVRRAAIGPVAFFSATSATSTFIGSVVLMLLARSRRDGTALDGTAPQPPTRAADGLDPSWALLSLAWLDSATGLSLTLGAGAGLSLLTFGQMLVFGFWLGYAGPAARWFHFAWLAGLAAIVGLVPINLDLVVMSLHVGSGEPPPGPIAAALFQLWAFNNLGARLRAAGWVPRPDPAIRVGTPDGPQRLVDALAADLRRACAPVLAIGAMVAMLHLWNQGDLINQPQAPSFSQKQSQAR